MPSGSEGHGRRMAAQGGAQGGAQDRQKKAEEDLRMLFDSRLKERKQGRATAGMVCGKKSLLAMVQMHIYKTYLEHELTGSQPLFFPSGMAYKLDWWMTGQPDLSPPRSHRPPCSRDKTVLWVCPTALECFQRIAKVQSLSFQVLVDFLQRGGVPAQAEGKELLFTYRWANFHAEVENTAKAVGLELSWSEAMEHSPQPPSTSTDAHHRYELHAVEEPTQFTVTYSGSGEWINRVLSDTEQDVYVTWIPAEIRKMTIFEDMERKFSEMTENSCRHEWNFHVEDTEPDTPCAQGMQCKPTRSQHTQTAEEQDELVEEGVEAGIIELTDSIAALETDVASLAESLSSCREDFQQGVKTFCQQWTSFSESE